MERESCKKIWKWCNIQALHHHSLPIYTVLYIYTVFFPIVFTISDYTKQSFHKYFQAEHSTLWVRYNGN